MIIFVYISNFISVIVLRIYFICKSFQGLTVKYDSDRGRHVIATENIKCGSYLACEDPIVNYLWSENMLSHCSNCFKYVTSLGATHRRVRS